MNKPETQTDSKVESQYRVIEKPDGTRAWQSKAEYDALQSKGAMKSAENIMNPLTTEQLDALEKSLDAYIKYCGIKHGEYNNWLYTAINALQLKSLIQSARELVEVTKKYEISYAVNVNDCETDTICRAIISSFGIDAKGDSYGVPSLEDCVEALANRLKLSERKLSVAIAALQEIKKSPIWNQRNMADNVLKTIAEMK